MLKEEMALSERPSQNRIGLSVHFSLQGKGGVGKSLVASLLSQYFLEKYGDKVFCVDSDPINATFSGYEELKADHLDVMRQGQVHERQFDPLIERICCGEGVFVIDTGATNFIPLWHYILENKILRLLGDQGCKAFVHVVIVGGQGLKDTLSGLDEIAETTSGRNIVVWLNELVLGAMAAALIQQVDKSISEFRAAADRIQVRAGAALAEEVRTAIESVRNGLRADLEAGGYKARESVMEVHRAHSRRNFVRWFSAGLLAALALLFCGAVLGRLI